MKNYLEVTKEFGVLFIHDLRKGIKYEFFIPEGGCVVVTEVLDTNQILVQIEDSNKEIVTKLVF